MTATPLWFGPADRPLFGWLGVPDGDRARAGVVLCSPVGDEARYAHRTFRRLAEELTAAGFVTLRYDHPGLGDSAGRLDQLTSTAPWIAGVRAAVDLVRSRGVDFVAAVGMRLGATLLTQAAEGGDGRIDGLVLWDPCLSGRAFLREQQLLHQSFLANAFDTEEAAETPGYVYPEPLAGDVRALELAARVTRGRPTLVLTRPDRGDSRVRRRLEGSDVEWDAAEGQAELLDMPLFPAVPEATLARVVRWLSSVAPGGDRPVSPLEGGPVRIPAGDGVVVERAVTLPPFGLFGIATEPEEPRGRTWMVFFNVATEHHVGPGRAWVDLSRAWAAKGIRSLRLDLSGLGDSPAHDGQALDVNHAPEWLEDVPATLRLLSGARPADLVVIGLCSGGQSAVEAAIGTPTRGVCAVNPPLTSFALSKGSPVYDERREAFIPMPPVLLRVGQKHFRSAWWLWRLACQVAFRRAQMAVVERAVRAGTDVFVLCGPEEGQPFREVLYWRLVGEPRLRRSGRLRVVVSAEIDHALLGYQSRERAKQLLTEHVLGHFPLRQPAGAPV